MNPEKLSIFGDTTQGVPNPQIPFEHKYPTRFHGANFNIPQFNRSYAPAVNAKAPFMGLGAAPAAADLVLGPLPAYVARKAGLHGLGIDAPLVEGVAGGALMTWVVMLAVSAGIGGTVGYIFNPEKPEGTGKWVAIGSLAGAFAPVIGPIIVAVVASNKKKKLGR